MSIFRGWPYTNFHDLNLDRILERTEDAEVAVQTAEAAAVQAAADVQQAANDASAALSAANQALAIADPMSVIPQLSVQINFSNNTIRWYKQPDYDEITSFADLKVYLENYTDLSHSSSPNPAMIRIVPVSYSRWSHPSMDMSSIFGAQVSLFLSTADNAKYVSLVFNIPVNNGDIYKVVVSVDGASFNAFTYTDSAI